MVEILETLAPLALIIALGSALAHIRFLGPTFITDLNKLAFWVALPALIFTSADAGTDAGAGAQIFRLLGVMIAASLVVSILAWIVSLALGLPKNARGTMIQSSFRGNLAYIGIPVIANSFHALPVANTGHVMMTAVIVMVLTTAFYNMLAVVVLQASQATGGTNWRQMTRSIVLNPLILAGLLGLIVPFLHLRLPFFVDRALQSLGAAAIPIALLCIGGSLITVPLIGKHFTIVAAAMLKTLVLPLIVLGLAFLIGLDAPERRIVLILAACPTAAASFVMVRQMGGDEGLASGSIVLSTMLSAFSLAFALWLGS